MTQAAATPVVGAAPVTIRLHGLSVFAHHGVLAEERSLGQRFEFDVEVDLDDCAACRTDELEDSVGWEQVAELVVEVATRFRFQVLEALAEAVCTELLAEFTQVGRVRLAVRKPAPAMPWQVAWAGVRVERDRTDGQEGPDGA